MDVATTTGLALVERLPGERERLVRSGTITIRDAGDVEAAVDHVAADLPTLVAVEAPFIGVNAHTGLVLGTLLGRWLQALERRGLATVTVLASTWQLSCLAGLITVRSDRAARKAAAQLWCRRALGAELISDEADAACLAVHALRHASRPEPPPRKAVHRAVRAVDPLPGEGL